MNIMYVIFNNMIWICINCKKKIKKKWSFMQVCSMNFKFIQIVASFHVYRYCNLYFLKSIMFGHATTKKHYFRR